MKDSARPPNIVETRRDAGDRIERIAEHRVVDIVERKLIPLRLPGTRSGLLLVFRTQR